MNDDTYGQSSRQAAWDGTRDGSIPRRPMPRSVSLAKARMGGLLAHYENGGEYVSSHVLADQLLVDALQVIADGSCSDPQRVAEIVLGSELSNFGGREFWVEEA